MDTQSHFQWKNNPYKMLKMGKVYYHLLRIGFKFAV